LSALSGFGKLIVTKILSRYRLDVALGNPLEQWSNTSLILAGIFSILQTNGLDLSAFGILAGAVGVGIGFGLQKHHQQLH